MTKIVAGQRAPDFTLAGMNGQRFSLSQALQKGPVVAAFFKITCPVCQFSLPFLERLAQAYGSSKVTFWAISQDDARDTKEFCEEYGLHFPALLDEEGYPASNKYGLTNVPTLFLIAPDGKVQVSSVGFSKADIEKISAELGRYLNRPPAPAFLSGEAIPDYKPG